MIVARSTPSSSSPAPSARRNRASELDRSARPRQSDNRAANAHLLLLVPGKLDV